VSVAKDIDTMTKPKVIRSVQEKAPRSFKPLEESLKEEDIDSTGKARCPSCKSNPCEYAFYNLASDN
jgi:hypothetical protein